MEIKQGDTVRVSEDAPKLIFGGCDMSQIVYTVCRVDKDVAAINMINDERTEMKVWIIPTKYLVKVDEEAKDTIDKYMQPFSEVIRRFLPHNNTREEFLNILREMGDTETKIEELNTISEEE